MNKIDYKELNFPRGLNLDLLAKILPEDKLMGFLVKHSKEDRLKRRIILPSRKTMKKVLCFYIWSQIKEEKTTWEKIKSELKSEFKTLKALDITKAEVKRLYNQRFMEIMDEKHEKK